MKDTAIPGIALAQHKTLFKRDINVDKDSRNLTFSQFHQHFTSSFCPDILSPKKFQIQTVIRETLLCIIKLLVICW